jgi:hypothetical protein
MHSLDQTLADITHATLGLSRIAGHGIHEVLQINYDE